MRAQLYQHAVHHLSSAGKVSLPLGRKARQLVDDVVASASGFGLADAMRRIENIARR
jgi:hypothetical protein